MFKYLILFILLSTPAFADPWYCPFLKSAVSSFGEAEVTRLAKKKGYSSRQINQAKKECHL